MKLCGILTNAMIYLPLYVFLWICKMLSRFIKLDTFFYVFNQFLLIFVSMDAFCMHSIRFWWIMVVFVDLLCILYALHSI